MRAVTEQSHRLLIMDKFKLLLTAAAAALSLLQTGCSSPAGRADGPSWSLGSNKSTGETSAPASQADGKAADPAHAYAYRGGRDPATGLAGPPAWQNPSAQYEPAPLPQVASPNDQLPARPWPRTPPADMNAAGDRMITVQKGDTLYGLSLQHHVSVSALKAANNLSADTILPGHKLVLPRS